ncbi:MAG: ATP-binding protein [Actinomycetota bacterium]|jgi:hypothetical protein|nr:ATP-binding protein [Actinomycetota bacterium]
MEDAFADLVDNSIDAGAKSVRIRILRRDDELRSVVIADDGEGMTEQRLDAAMGFGVRSEGDGPRLGKYGLGLKSASFSQCGRLTVVSRRRGGRAAGRMWTTAGIAEGWMCDTLEPNGADAYLNRNWLDGRRVQTIITWEDLMAFRIPAARSNSKIADLFDATELHLGLHLHRFIEDGLTITLDTYDLDTEESSAPRPVQALDPFGYPRTGQPSYPRVFAVQVPHVGRIKVDAHIWPTGIRPANLSLGRGQLAARQGFYFYRHNRIIQAGGWNGVRADAEPHLSLARARVELTPKHDEAFGLNVRKAGVNVPKGFAEAVLLSETDGASFRDYTAAAERVYRKNEKGRPHPSNFIMGKGVPATVQRVYHGQIKGRTTAVTFEWATLPPEQFFELDRDSYRIILNARYRKSVLHGKRGSGSDAALVKTLLFMRLKEDLGKERLWTRRSSELDNLQALLVNAAQQEDR